MQHVWSDIRFGVRMLVRYPTLSAVSILTFGLGLGLATAVFSVVNGVMYKGLPFEEADRIVSILGTNAERNVRRGPVSVHDVAVYEERQTAFEAFGAFSRLPINLSGDASWPEQHDGGALTVGAMRALRVTPVLGRSFVPGDDRPGAPPVILVSYRVWQERFRGVRDVIGTTVRANGVARTIVGVMPEGFAFPNLEEVWIPLVLDPLASPRGEGPGYRVIGRLRAGATIGEAQTQLRAMAASLEHDHPETNRGVSVAVLPFIEGSLGPELFALLYTMFGAGIGVLLIACVNVSNLLLARASLRQREVAVRVAIGAGRARLLAQILTEVVVLAGAGALVGLAVSSGAMHWFVSAIQADPPPFFITFGLDARVLLFAGAVALLAAVFAGAWPAFQATRLDVTATLKDDSRGATGFRSGRIGGALVVAEMALSCALLVAAGLMAKSVAEVRTIDLPFAVESIAAARVTLPRDQYADPAGRIRFYNALLPEVRALPGVESATLSDGLPADGNGTEPIELPGRRYAREADYPVVREGIITPGYFETFEVKVLRGREFSVQDQPGNLPVAIVNESFAKAHFGGEDPIGRQFRKGRGTPDRPWLTVVGLVPDLLMQGFGNSTDSPAGYYIPVAQSDVGFGVNIAVRTRGALETLAPALRSAVNALDDSLALYDLRSMATVVARQTMFYHVFGTFFFAFGLSALFLAAAGLYGVMSFAVTRRTRELGVRSALGASGPQLVRLVMRQAVVQSAVGLALGLALGLLATGALEPLLYRVGPRDPVVLGAVVAALALTGLLTGLFATRRVVRLDPVVALADE